MKPIPTDLAIVFVWSLLLCETVAIAHPPQGCDASGGVLSLEGRTTGWFHLEEIFGRWYFVTPEGHAFFSIGATHAVECTRQDERNLFATKYGQSEERLAEFFLERFKDWGYNSSGYGPLPTMEKRISSRSAARKASQPMTRLFSTGLPASTTPVWWENCARPILIIWSWATG